MRFSRFLELETFKRTKYKILLLTLKSFITDQGQLLFERFYRNQSQIIFSLNYLNQIQKKLAKNNLQFNKDYLPTSFYEQEQISRLVSEKELIRPYTSTFSDKGFHLKTENADLYEGKDILEVVIKKEEESDSEISNESQSSSLEKSSGSELGSDSEESNKVDSEEISSESDSSLLDVSDSWTESSFEESLSAILTSSSSETEKESDSEASGEELISIKKINKK
jgi:hypothetical protein